VLHRAGPRHLGWVLGRRDACPTSLVGARAWDADLARATRSRERAASATPGRPASPGVGAGQARRLPHQPRGCEGLGCGPGARNEEPGEGGQCDTGKVCVTWGECWAGETPAPPASWVRGPVTRTCGAQRGGGRGRLVLHGAGPRHLGWVLGRRDACPTSLVGARACNADLRRTARSQQRAASTALPRPASPGVGAGQARRLPHQPRGWEGR